MKRKPNESNMWQCESNLTIDSDKDSTWAVASDNIQDT